MIILTRTDSYNKDFIELVKKLDAYLAIVDGKDHSFYAQFNKIDALNYVIVAYDDNKPVGCGAIKEYAPGTMELKRMFTLPEYRGRGIAAQVLAGLEIWAVELSCNKCILETGKRQDDAIAFYKKNGYSAIPNFGQYAGIENSVCFQKEIK